MSRTARAKRKAPRAPSTSPYANKVTDERTRLLVRSFIARSIVRGWSQQKTAEQIHAQLGISMIRQNVSYIARSIMDEAAERVVKDPDKALAGQILRIDASVEALWEAWEKSSGRREITVSRARRTATDDKGHPIGRASDVDDAMTRTEEMLPDPRYMTAIARFEELRAKLMGLLREPKEDDGKKPVPPSTINVNVRVSDGGTLNMGGGPSQRDQLPAANGQVIDVTPGHAPALTAGPPQPGAYR